MTLLERRGARAVEAPAIRIISVADDAELLAATRRYVEQPPDVVVVTTGIACAGSWRPLTARGHAAGALRRRRAGDPRTEGEGRSTGSRPGRGGIAGQRVERGGAPPTAGRGSSGSPGGRPAARRAAAEVLRRPAYGRCRGRGDRGVPMGSPRGPPATPATGRAGLRRQVDCVTFTSAPAATSLLTTARQGGRQDALVAALRTTVLAACVGPVTAAPLQALGVPTVQPERARLAGLVRTVVEQLPLRRTGTRAADGHVR